MIVTSIKCDMTSNTLHDFPCTLSKHTRRCLSRTKRIIIGISDSYTGFRVQIFSRSISACLAVRQQLLKPQTSIKYIREKAIQLASDKWISYLLLYTHANVFKHESKLYFNIHFEPNIAFTRLDLIHTGSSYRCICCYLYVENSILICTLWLLTKKSSTSELSLCMTFSTEYIYRLVFHGKSNRLLKRAVGALAHVEIYEQIQTFN